MTDPDDRAGQALRAALAHHADRLEPVALLAPVRRRPRWALVAAAAATAMAVSATAAAIVIGNDSDVAPTAGPRGTPTASASASTSASTSAATSAAVDTEVLGLTRTVAFRDVTVEVPATWRDEYAPTDQWCIDTDIPTAPYVARDHSMLVSTQVGCILDRRDTGVIPSAQFPPVPPRLWASHLSLLPGDDVPDGVETFDGWTLTTRTIGSVRVELLTDAASTPLVEAILATTRVVDVDPSGCDTFSPAQRVNFTRPEPFDVTALDTVTSISVCHYTRHASGASGLLGSRVIGGAAAQGVLESLQAAPVGGGPDEPQNCIHDEYGDTALVVRLMQDDQQLGDVYVYYDWCFGNGSDDGTTRRELTRGSCAALFGGPVMALSYQSSLREICGDA